MEQIQVPTHNGSLDLTVELEVAEEAPTQFQSCRQWKYIVRGLILRYAIKGEHERIFPFTYQVFSEAAEVTTYASVSEKLGENPNLQPDDPPDLINCNQSLNMCGA